MTTIRIENRLATTALTWLPKSRAAAAAIIDGGEVDFQTGRALRVAFSQIVDFLPGEARIWNYVDGKGAGFYKKYATPEQVATLKEHEAECHEIATRVRALYDSHRKPADADFARRLLAIMDDAEPRLREMASWADSQTVTVR